LLLKVYLRKKARRQQHRAFTYICFPNIKKRQHPHQVRAA
jgi:hypothetical protein